MPRKPNRSTTAQKAAELKAVMEAPKLKLKTPAVRRRVRVSVMVNVSVEIDVKAEDPDDLATTVWDVVDVVRVCHPDVSESDIREQSQETLDEIDRLARLAPDLEPYDD